MKNIQAAFKPPSTHLAHSAADMGALLRDLRKRKGMTLQALADAIGRSVGFVSQIERGLSQPTVEDINVIQQVLAVPTTYFFPKATSSTYAWCTHPGERRALSYAQGVTDYLASPDLSTRFCMLETALEPGAQSGERNLLDNDEHGGYVLAGLLTMRVGEEELVLKAGDAFQLPSGTPCHFSNPGKVPARVLWVLSR